MSRYLKRGATYDAPAPLNADDELLSDLVNASGGSGGSGAPITEVTYAELVTLLDADGLSVGQQYLITDYATKHFIVDTAGTQYLDSIITGATEGLIVTAVATNKISHEAKSILYPQDIIHYDWKADNWLDDLSFADLSGTPTIVTGFKGVIYFRHDTLLDNYMGYDFRNCKFRRWKTNVPAWDSGTTYSAGDFVNYSGDGFIYRALKGSNTNQTPSGGSDYWVRLLDLSLTEYYCSEPTTLGIPSGSEYIDVKTFAEGTGTATYERCCLSNHFEPFKDNHTDYDTAGTILMNNVCFLQDYGAIQIFSNKFGAEAFGNTISTNFDNNIIGSSLYKNVIGYYFVSNIIGTKFSRNIIATNFNTNTIGNDFAGNTIGDSFAMNTVASQFLSNTIGQNFSNNTIGNNFQNNVITNLFNYNTVYDSVQSIDYTAATYVYAAYHKTIFKRVDGAAKLSYFDNSNAQQIVNANA